MDKVTKFYIVFILLIIGYFTYATWNGMTYWEDKPEKNTQYNNSNRSHSGYGNRFYHK